VWTNEHSVATIIYALYRTNEYFLAAVIAIFSVVCPFLKPLYLLTLCLSPNLPSEFRRKSLSTMEWLGRYSMTDVMVLALMIFFLKSTGIYDAKSLSGVYFFTAAVVFMILAYAWLSVFALAPIRAEHLRAERARPVVGIGGRSALKNFLLALFILTAAISFALGVILPSIRFTTVYVWTNEHSVATIIYALYRTNEYFLAAVIAIFSVVFPFLKLLYLLTLCLSPNLPSEFRRKSLSTMEWLGRYSMTDVMVLALMIFYMNSSGYTEARVLPGVYFFAAAAMMTMFAYGWANSPPPPTRMPSTPLPPERGMDERRRQRVA
jgi:paraquat-inducible protein A